MHDDLSICDRELNVDLTPIADRSQKTSYTALDKISVQVGDFLLEYEPSEINEYAEHKK